MLWFRFAVASVFFVGSANAALAEDGGNPFTLACEEGSYLTGFEGRVGAWIDKVTIYCAKWKDIQLEVPSSMGAKGFAGWSGGGDPRDVSCPSGTLIAGPWSTRYTRDDDNLVLHSILFNCRRAFDKPEELTLKTFGSDFKRKHRTGDALLKDTDGQCRDDEVATGIEGRSGLYVDALRILCGPVPNYSNTRAAGRKGGDAVIVGGELKRKGGNIIVGGAAPNSPPPPTPPAKPTATAKADVDIHEGPDGDTKVIGMLGNKTTVPVLGHDNEKDWYRLQVGNITGWVAADWLTINP